MACMPHLPEEAAKKFIVVFSDPSCIKSSASFAFFSDFCFSRRKDIGGMEELEQAVGLIQAEGKKDACGGVQKRQHSGEKRRAALKNVIIDHLPVHGRSASQSMAIHTEYASVLESLNL